MKKSKVEENVGLLLESTDEENQETNIRLKDRSIDGPTTKKTNRTKSKKNSRWILFLLILLGFIVGCLTGLLIIQYKYSESNKNQRDLQSLLTVDSGRTKDFLQSINRNEFLNLNNSAQSEIETANRLETLWKSSSKTFDRVDRIDYDLTLVKYSSLSQWNGIEVQTTNSTEKILKYSCLSTDEYLTFLSLVKSGDFTSNSIYYVNYGRAEDFSYLIQRNVINWTKKDETIVFMRRNPKKISQIEQIRQVNYYKFSGLVLFDDEDQNENSTKTDRLSLVKEWQRIKSEQERNQFIDGLIDVDENPVPTLILSWSDVKQIFSSVEQDKNRWISSPDEWKIRGESLPLGGTFQEKSLRFVVHFQEFPVHLPNIFGLIRGKDQTDNFLLVVFRLSDPKQEKIINQIVQSFDKQIQSGWKPKRSIVFSGWSANSYDFYSIRRWIDENLSFIEKNLLGVIDLGQGVQGNSTLNIHGSSLFERVSQISSENVVSPLKHDHFCHHRDPSIQIHQQYRRHSDHQDKNINSNRDSKSETCQPHKLFDEWIRTSKNRFQTNKTQPIVQPIDRKYSASSIFQLQFGVPSIIVEMTEESSVRKNDLYSKPGDAMINDQIEAETFVGYTQFLVDLTRRLIDEPLIPFNLSDYADRIEQETNRFLSSFIEKFDSLKIDSIERNKFKSTIDDLTETIRRVQLRIDQNNKSNFFSFQSSNEKFLRFERLFIFNDQGDPTKIFSVENKHILSGVAFGLTNTIVDFPYLSNIIFDLDDFSPEVFREIFLSRLTKFNERIRSIQRNLLGIESLFI